MPSFNRRGFLQLIGAASAMPLMPALPANATVTRSGAAVSKALWRSLHANAGSSAKFVGIAKGMGLSNSAIQGVGARSVGVRLSVAAAANSIPITKTAPVSGHPAALENRIKQAFEHLAVEAPVEMEPEIAAPLPDGQDDAISTK